MSRILPLFAALAELFLSGRSPSQVAAQFQIDADVLTHASKVARGNLWKGHLARALQCPAHRPELLTHFSSLAALEHHYGLLMAQWQRAEETCRQLRALKDPDIALQMKADAFSFRIEQAAARILRDLQKAEVILQKAIAAPYISFTAEMDESLHPQKHSPHSATPPKNSPATEGVAKNTAHNVAHNVANNVAQNVAQNVSQNTAHPNSTPIAAPLPPPASTPSKALVENAILLKNRELIKNTPAEDRPALIARLFEQQKPKGLAA